MDTNSPPGIPPFCYLFQVLRFVFAVVGASVVCFLLLYRRDMVLDLTPEMLAAGGVGFLAVSVLSILDKVLMHRRIREWTQLKQVERDTNQRLQLTGDARDVR